MKAEPYLLPFGVGVVEFIPREPAEVPEEFRYDAYISVEFTLHRPAPEAVAIWLGMPHYYRFHRRAIEAPRPRLALPWGDSAYTTWVVRRWAPDIPPLDPADAIWAAGPPDNGLTPSSEGPRRDPFQNFHNTPTATTAAHLRRVLDLLRDYDVA